MDRSVAILFTLLFFSCSSPSSDTLLLQESAKLHEEAIIIADSIEAKLRKGAFAEQDSVDLLLHEITMWRAELIEVPGHEHHHSHNHSHDHTPVNVTSAEMLTIQKELKHHIEQIRKRSEALTTNK